MKDSPILATFAWLVRDTFRQSLAHGILWVLLVTSVLSIGVCLSISADGRSTLYQGDEPPDFISRRHPDANNAEKLKSSGRDRGRRRFFAGLWRDRGAAGPRHEIGDSFFRVDSGRRRGRHAGPAADFDLDGRIPAQLFGRP